MWCDVQAALCGKAILRPPFIMNGAQLSAGERQCVRSIFTQCQMTHWSDCLFIILFFFFGISDPEGLPV